MARQVAQRRKQQRRSTQVCEGATVLSRRTVPVMLHGQQQDVEDEEEESSSLEAARLVIRQLRERSRAQSHKLAAWQRRLKLQGEAMVRVQRERDEQMRRLSSQLLVFESRLRRKQEEIHATLNVKEKQLEDQRDLIDQLRSQCERLCLEEGITQTVTTLVPNDTGGRNDTTVGGSPGVTAATNDSDSLNDSDSAIIMEEGILDVPLPSFNTPPDVKIVRSVSDALECKASHVSHMVAAAAAVDSAYDGLGNNSSSVCALKRYNGLLRRPEVLETVYSVEEEGEDSESVPVGQGADNYDEGGGVHDHDDDDDDDDDDDESCRSEETPRRFLFGSYERLNRLGSASLKCSAQLASPSSSPCLSSSSLPPMGNFRRRGYTSAMGTPTRAPGEDSTQLTYNRVMSNHRAVVKPRDVKYKRINKARSRSLEELRGRLKSLVEKAGVAVTVCPVVLDQSFA